METLPKDLRRKIALELSPADVVRFCLTESESNQEICNSDAFWRLKYARDYPDLFYYHEKNKVPLRNPKNAYMRTFSNYRKTIEDFSKQHSIKEEELDNLYQSVRKNPKDYTTRREFVKKFPIPKQSLGSLFYALEKIDGYVLRHGKST